MLIYSKQLQNVDSLKRKTSCRFEVYGQEIAERTVRRCGTSGRIYLPQEWVGCRVKIVKVK